MQRRKFIQLSSYTSALSLIPTEIFALFKSAGMSFCPNVNAKKIVLIQFAGANDGLNTVVPINQYDLYAALRPNIKLSNTGTNKIINLDTTLSLSNQVGLHPSLTGFKSLYDKGLMRLIQGVGYPAQDKSHFKSTDLWLTGGDGTPDNNHLGSGWMGRFLENYYSEYLTANFPLGIQLGSNENSLGFHGEEEHGMSINLNRQDPAGFYSIINGLGGIAPTTIPNSEYGDLIRFILENDSSTSTYSQSISTSFTAGSNSVTYADTTLSNQLKTVAKLISGGLQTKVYLVKLDGFDTHNLQVASNATSHLGTHANLLAQVSAAVESFITDLNNQGMGDDVIAVTFSEFGRKAGENANLGTDHGEIAPMFVFGSSLNGGVSGTNVNLSEAVLSNNYQIRTVQHDYRRVFSTILQDWFGVSNPTLDLTFYNQTNHIGYTGNKVENLINAKNLVTPNCYTDKSSVGTGEPPTNNNELQVYPNPSSDFVSIKASLNLYSVSLYSVDGKLINTFKNPQTSNQLTINVQNLAAGVYLLKVNAENKFSTKKIVVKR